MNTKARRSFFLALCSAAVLTACGGGGGGSTATPVANTSPPPVAPVTPVDPAPPATPGGSWLTFTPSPVSVTTYEGDTTQFRITATSIQTFTKRFNVGVVDSKGLISTDVEVDMSSALTAVTALRTSTALKQGTYSTNIEVRLCEDEPQTCKLPLPGSPWYVPLTVTVKPGTNLTALSAMPGVPSWSTYQGNAAHSGYVPAAFNAAAFTRRWGILAEARNPSEGVRLATEPVLDNGKLYLARSAWVGHSNLVAIDEATGQTAWSVDIGDQSLVNPPAAANGKIYLVATVDLRNTFLFVFDQVSGALISKTLMESQGQTMLAPTVFGDGVYTDYGLFDGLARFGAADGRLAWSIRLTQLSGWTPAVDASHAYVYLNGRLNVIDVANGNIAYTIDIPLDDGEGIGSAFGAVVLGNGVAYRRDGRRLIGFDLAKRSTAWVNIATPNGQPALANGVLYVAGSRGTALEARAASTGALQWSTTLPRQSVGYSSEFRNVIVTDKLAFAASSDSTVAVDLATHAVVWTYPLGGMLSISNRGVLYIVTDQGQIAAINLR